MEMLSNLEKKYYEDRTSPIDFLLNQIQLKKGSS